MSPRRFHVLVLACGVLALALVGCASTRYKSNSPAPAPKLAEYPIQFYTPEMRIPRPCKLIGTVSIHGGHFTIHGGSSDAEFIKLMRIAHQKGADAVRVTSVEKPGFTNPNSSLEADLLRYTDTWETIPMSKFQFQSYLDAHQSELDPIEGIWFGDLPIAHSIAIMRSHSKPGRDFVAFVLDYASLAWPTGTKKIDIRRGLEPGSYILTYYLDDFASREVPIILGQQHRFRINLPKDDEDFFVTYKKY